jgi:hypothetical protein
MDRQGRIKKENKNLGTEKCEYIDTLYTNKIIIARIILYTEIVLILIK